MSDKAVKKKFKQTKQLVRMAINDGWTQKKIAERCRTQQSIVSEWYNGTKQGNEQQLAPLLEQYGAQLRRNSFRVYCCIDKVTKIENYYRVEGKKIFSSTCYNITGRVDKTKRTAAIKIIVHYQGNGVFRLIYQTKRPVLAQSVSHTALPLTFNFDDDDAYWMSDISSPLTMLELLNHILQISESLKVQCANEAQTLPYLIRKALLNYGFSVEDVVDIPATW